MSKPRIGVILSTTRVGRFAGKVADWLLELVAARKDLVFELVDLRDYPLPFFDEAKPSFTPTAPYVRAVMIAAGAFVLLYAVFPAPLIDAAAAAAKSFQF